jgi:hypothetical protein
LSASFCTVAEETDNPRNVEYSLVFFLYPYLWESVGEKGFRSLTCGKLREVEEPLRVEKDSVDLSYYQAKAL